MAIVARPLPQAASKSATVRFQHPGQCATLPSLRPSIRAASPSYSGTQTSDAGSEEGHGAGKGQRRQNFSPSGLYSRTIGSHLQLRGLGGTLRLCGYH